jgi:hypothetical protein
MDAARGRNPYLFAALKSLPLADEQPEQQQEEQEGQGEVSEGSDQRLAATAGEQDLAGALLEQVDFENGSCSTSLKEDEELLQQLLGDSSSSGSKGEGLGGTTEGGEVDVRLIAAVRYRIERKRLLQATHLLLRLFLRT